ncbi:MAG: serpin family protein [Acidimicrobiia bacterium]
MADPSSTAALVTRYAQQFDAVVGATGHTVSSPLGAWLLVALAAPLTTGDERAEVEAVLGTTADDAHARAAALLAQPHDAVAHAVAVWHREELVRPAFTEWSDSLHDVETGPVPSQEGADRWTSEHTKGLIEHFPAEIDELSALVLASALATKVQWTTPFGRVPSVFLDAELSPAPGSWGTLVQRVLAAPRTGHDIGVVDTERVGQVGVHAAESADGLVVVSVMADPDRPRHDVRVAALDVATALVCGDTTSARRIGIADLPVGPHGAWELREETVDRDRQPAAERTEAFLPAWGADAQHDLAGVAAPGIAPTLTTLAALVASGDGPPDMSAVQAAVARYTSEGFEAAAVTAMVARTLSRPKHTHTQRVLTVRFDRPYAVVAVARDDAAPTPADSRGWHGVPVFSAWVETPAEAEASA